jgi:hypothetical protein
MTLIDRRSLIARLLRSILILTEAFLLVSAGLHCYWRRFEQRWQSAKGLTAQLPRMHGLGIFGGGTHRGNESLGSVRCRTSVSFMLYCVPPYEDD